MGKEDLVIEFYKILERVEKRFFENRYELMEKQKKFWESFHENHLHKPFDSAKYTGAGQTITFPFNHEFYLQGKKCKINQRINITVIE